MMLRLLRLKHWQLFILFFGILMGSFTTSENPTIISAAFSISMTLYTGLIFAWFYALGVNLYKKLPKAATMNLKRFKLFLFIPLTYSLFMFSVLFDFDVRGQFMIDFFVLVFPLHLISGFCGFYCLYFNAKALKTVEYQKPVTISDFVGEFFLIWFFCPIGIWIIQPRVNRIFDTPINESFDATL